MQSSRKDTAKSIKSLIVLLQSLRGQKVTITLRNDTTVRGVVIKVDANMNIELKNATIEPDKFYRTDDMDESQLSSPVDLIVQGSDVVDDMNIRLETMTNESSQSICNAGELSSHSQNKNPIVTVVGDTSEDSEQGDDDETGDNANLCEPNTEYDYLVVKGSRIRHLDLPNDSDLLQATREEILRIRNRRRQWTKRDAIRSS